MADRPGDFGGAQPAGDQLGTPGPDQGYAFKLAKQFAGRLHPGRLDNDDVTSGCVAIASKRAGLFGRAPMVYDLTAAFTIWGFLDPGPPPDLVELRERLFPQVASPHHYVERREIVDRVSAEVLLRPHAAIKADYVRDWTANIAG
jgi:hypothetical protein